MDLGHLRQQQERWKARAQEHSKDRDELFETISGEPIRDLYTPVDLEGFELVESAKEVRPSERVDHRFVYERQAPTVGEEGRYRLTIAFGCTGGRHRSVAVGEAVFDSLKKSDYGVSLEHRHLELG